MKRASYRDGVAWIAWNDDPGSDDALDLDVVDGYLSTVLLAHLFGKDPAVVARDVVRVRHQKNICPHIATEDPQ